LVDSVVEAKEAVKNCKQTGCTEIKIYSLIKPELVPKIIQLIHSEGLRDGGHVPAFMSAEQFVNAGVDELHHLNFIFLNFWFDEVKDTRGPARITKVGNRAATTDLNSEKVRSFVKLLKDKKIVVDPTLNVYENQFVREFGFPIPEGKTEQCRNSFKKISQMVKILYDSGVTITAGTDAGGAWALHRELELYVDAGIPAHEVLRIATLGAAKVMKLDRKLGSIEPGKLADVILVDGNPAERICDIRRVSLVVKNGRIYDSTALNKSIGIGR
jgi:hypothetical protein